MGVMENMLHSESPRTVTSVNGSHSEGRSAKLVTENGDCSFLACPPKYKRRKVSAVRDFPPGCGPFAPRIQPRKMLEQKTLLTYKEENLVFSSFQVNESVNAEAVEMQSPALKVLNSAGLSGPLVSLKHAACDFSRDLNSMSDSASNEETLLKSSSKCLSPSDGPGAVPNGIGLGKTMAKRYPPRRKVSAVRDFPPFCGRNAPCLSKEERVKAPASPKNTSLGQEKTDMVDKPLEVTEKSDVNRMVEGVQTTVARKGKLHGNVSVVSGGKSEMKVDQDDIRKMCSKPSFESDNHILDHNSKILVFKELGDTRELEEKEGKEIVAYQEHLNLQTNLSEISDCWKRLQEEDTESLGPLMDRVVVQGLMAAPNSPWSQGKVADKLYSTGITSEGKAKKYSSLPRGKQKSSVRTKDEANNSKAKSEKKNSSFTGNAANQGLGQIILRDEKDSTKVDGEYSDFFVPPSSCSFGVNLPPIGTSINDNGHNSDAVTRNKVRETLRLFQAVCRKLLQEEEAKSRERGSSNRRVDCKAAKILKEKDKYLNTGKQILGSVPGIEVGDEFHYRVELNIIGIHRQIQGGIDYVKHHGKILATSVVASGGYDDDLENSDSLIYTGQGGNVMNTDKEPEDQKLKRGNLALKNSVHERNPVRVIRGSESSDGKTYIYDGLYLVEKYWQDFGPHGKLVFKFQLRRIPGQPELAWKEVKKSKKFKIREGLCVDDISQGKELTPISAVNTVDDEKPPPFEYITSMIYPSWCQALPPEGCTCINGCSDSEICFCAVKNGGEIPFNYNGAIVEAKPLVYECGPSCKCPPSCHNRVSQHGIKFQLEIFKTTSRGWGVRSLNSIPSGSFICEYIGELLEEKEAERRTGNDEYLFDIGNSYNDISLWDGLSSLMPEAQASSCEVVEDVGFTIDAAKHGNVGRFINHSCSPNLYAQNVLYDHEDKRIPHIMLFAAENIPPLQELTYHYNYMLDQVRDSNGNIKKKSCYCGSIECTGRLY